jgi:hypothetical protein
MGSWHPPDDRATVSVTRGGNQAVERFSQAGTRQSRRRCARGGLDHASSRPSFGNSQRARPRETLVRRRGPLGDVGSPIPGATRSSRGNPYPRNRSPNEPRPALRPGRAGLPRSPRNRWSTGVPTTSRTRPGYSARHGSRVEVGQPRPRPDTKDRTGLPREGPIFPSTPLDERTRAELTRAARDRVERGAAVPERTGLAGIGGIRPHRPGAVRPVAAGRARAEERVPGAAPARAEERAPGAARARAGWAVGESAAKQSPAFALGPKGGRAPRRNTLLNAGPLPQPMGRARQYVAPEERELGHGLDRTGGPMFAREPLRDMGCGRVG